MTMNRAKMSTVDPARGSEMIARKEFHAQKARAKGKSGKGHVKTHPRRGGRK